MRNHLGIYTNDTLQVTGVDHFVFGRQLECTARLLYFDISIVMQTSFYVGIE